jgi:uncharacterized coiled-coil DUF342 family protein
MCYNLFDCRHVVRDNPGFEVPEVPGNTCQPASSIEEREQETDSQNQASQFTEYLVLKANVTKLTAELKAMSETVREYKESQSEYKREMGAIREELEALRGTVRGLNMCVVDLKETVDRLSSELREEVSHFVTCHEDSYIFNSVSLHTALWS